VATVGLVLHHERAEAAAAARELTAWLVDAGHHVRVPASDAATAGLDEHGVDEADFAAGLDAAVSLGGDGCMLQAVQLVAAEGVAILGVNLGQLGYLTEVEPAGLRDAVDRLLSGDHEVEERMLLDVQISRAAGSAEPPMLALNDAVIGKSPTGHTVRIEVAIDGKPFTPYAADAVIVATPTGSTAYNLSARGPIVAPTHHALLLTPVSPHMLFDRSLVLEPRTRLTLTVAAERPATLSVDGRTLDELQPGDSVACTASAHRARLVTFGPRDFHQILKAKFQLSDR
jgi:NAD+ kinase